jgi:hypothetical protein
VITTGCGCNGTATPIQGSDTAKSGSFYIQNPDGTKAYFSTELAARAANAKQGNRGMVRPNGTGARISP